MPSSMDGRPGIHFPAHRRAQYDEICDDLIHRTVQAHADFHSAAALGPWKLLRQRDSLNVYRARMATESEHDDVKTATHTTEYNNNDDDIDAILDAATITTSQTSNNSRSRSGSSSRKRKNNKKKKSLSLLMCSGFLPGTVDDILRGLYADNTESFRLVKSILSNKFMDGAVVHVLETQPLHASIFFTGIKRTAVKTPGQFICDREYLTYERMGRIVDRHQNYFGYHVLQSIDLPEYPANRSHHLERAYLSVCYLYRQLSPDWVGCFMLGNFDANGFVPQLASDYVAALHMLSVRHALASAHAKDFSMMITANANATSSTSRHCDLCLSTPKFLDSSHKLCMGCRRRVCKKCRERRIVFRLHARTRRPEKELFCRACVDQVVHQSYENDENNDSSPPADYRPRGASASPNSSEASNDPFEPWLSPGKTQQVYGSSSSQSSSPTVEMSGFSAADSGNRNGITIDVDKVASFAQSCQNRKGLTGFYWNKAELARLANLLGSSKQKLGKEGVTNMNIAMPFQESTGRASAKPYIPLRSTKYRSGSTAYTPHDLNSSESTPKPGSSPGSAPVSASRKHGAADHAWTNHDERWSDEEEEIEKENVGHSYSSFSHESSLSAAYDEVDKEYNRMQEIQKAQSRANCINVDELD